MLRPVQLADFNRQNTCPLQELRVKGSYLHHKEVKAAQGIKIAANGLESAVAGTQVRVTIVGTSMMHMIL
jgi:translation initiation factor IF-2